MQGYTANQQMIVDSFNSSTYVQDRMDVQHTPIYDTVTYAQAGVINETNSLFFTNVGGTSSKTVGQTNMTQSQKLQAPEAFSIFAIRLRFSEDTNPIDILSIMNTQALEFWLGQKPYNRAPIWHFNAGGGLQTMQSNSVALASGFTTYGPSFSSNGMTGRSEMHKLAIPIVIENQMTFYARLVGNPVTLLGTAAGGVGTILQLELDGLYARGVQ